MLDKTQVIHTIETLPDTFSMDVLIDEIILSQKIKDETEQSAKGMVLSQEEVEAKFSKWLK